MRPRPETWSPAALEPVQSGTQLRAQRDREQRRSERFKGAAAPQKDAGPLRPETVPGKVGRWGKQAGQSSGLVRELAQARLP